PYAGKTLAFILPLVERLQNEGVGRERDRQPRALIMGPVREFVKEISDHIHSINSDLSVATIYGDEKYEDQGSSSIVNNLRLHRFLRVS
ncbi:unnamed protein product, partial [Didymodactylos carnosus]